jgi:hypothetical protein
MCAVSPVAPPAQPRRGVEVLLRAPARGEHKLVVCGV